MPSRETGSSAPFAVEQAVIDKACAELPPRCLGCFRARMKIAAMHTVFPKRTASTLSAELSGALEAVCPGHKPLPDEMDSETYQAYVEIDKLRKGKKPISNSLAESFIGGLASKPQVYTSGRECKVFGDAEREEELLMELGRTSVIPPAGYKLPTKAERLEQLLGGLR